jgi:hypothetical protein
MNDVRPTQSEKAIQEILDLLRTDFSNEDVIRKIFEALLSSALTRKFTYFQTSGLKLFKALLVMSVREKIDLKRVRQILAKMIERLKSVVIHARKEDALLTPYFTENLSLPEINKVFDKPKLTLMEIYDRYFMKEKNLKLLLKSWVKKNQEFKKTVWNIICMPYSAHEGQLCFINTRTAFSNRRNFMPDVWEIYCPGCYKKAESEDQRQ